MKKRIILSLLIGTLTLTSAMPVFAAPKQMADGTMFDAEYYAANNPDIVAVLGNEEKALYNHYVNYGKNEGRKPCADSFGEAFDPVYYAQNNPDVVAVLGTDATVLYNHYVNCGKNEGRKPCADGYVPAENTVPAQPTYVIDWNDDCNGQWKEKKTWTASNGIVLRIKDEYAHWDFENNPAARSVYSAYEIIVLGSPADYKPGTEFMKAMYEFQYGISAYEVGWERMLISAEELPLVELATTKQTSIVKTDSWNAYAKAFEPLWGCQVTGTYTDKHSGFSRDSRGHSIGLFNGLQLNYVWDLYRKDDGWELYISKNPTELVWNSIRNVLRLIDPEAENRYNYIYNGFYNDIKMIEYGMIATWK